LITFLFFPSVIVVIVLIRPPPVGLLLLLPHIKCLNVGVYGHLLHALAWLTDEEESWGAGLTIF
jgi:hypothetical protein